MSLVPVLHLTESSASLDWVKSYLLGPVLHYNVSPVLHWTGSSANSTGSSASFDLAQCFMRLDPVPH